MGNGPGPQELAYRKRVMDVLGSEDPLEVLGRTGEALAGIVRAHGVARLRARPFPGKWTPGEVIGHLCDCEWLYGYRARLILCEDNPTILGMDPDRWVAAQKHNDREPLDLVEQFRALRAPNLRLWQNLTPADLARTGQHSERGPESLDLLRTLLAGHDLLHLEQLTRTLAAIG